MSKNDSSFNNLKSRNPNIIINHKQESEQQQQINNKKREYSQTNNQNSFYLKEKKPVSQTISSKKQKYLTTLNTTNENTPTSENSKKANYYDKFINSRYAVFSEEEMHNKLNETKNDDMQFLNYIMNNIDHIDTNNAEINKEKENKFKFDFNIIRKYIIKIEKNFKKEAENVINKNKYNKNYFLIQYFLKKLHHLISRYGIIIFFFCSKEKFSPSKTYFFFDVKRKYYIYRLY